jgi:hypothetical protein
VYQCVVGLLFGAAFIPLLAYVLLFLVGVQRLHSMRC